MTSPLTELTRELTSTMVEVKLDMNGVNRTKLGKDWMGEENEASISPFIRRAAFEHQCFRPQTP